MAEDRTDNFIPGITSVRVMKREVNELTGRETIREIHKGIVVERTTSFLRVFNNAPTNKGGDLSPETSEMFPITSKMVWCEITGNRKESDRFPIPVTLR